jgi:hypothetical protein
MKIIYISHYKKSKQKQDIKMNKKVTLMNHKDYFGDNIVAHESKTDARFVLDLGNQGFKAHEVSHKTLSDGNVTVTGKKSASNPKYDADGNPDTFGHNAVRKNFQIKFQLNTAKYDVSTIKVSTEAGTTRVQAMKYGHTMKAPGSMNRGWYGSSPALTGYGCRNFAPVAPAPRPTYYAREAVKAYVPTFTRACVATCFGMPCVPSYTQSYYVPAPYTVRSGVSSAYAIQ